MDNILEVKNVTKEYKSFKLDNISFTLERGYIMGLIGENGAGKTTTIKLIMNLIKRGSGEIRLFGMDNITNERAVKEKIGFVYNDCFYYENMSIKDNAKMFSYFYSLWDWDKFREYMIRFKLNENQKVKELSKGMKMKFAIALALSHNAEFLILDEPTAGLDPVMRREILDILQQVMEDEKKGILISTHITSDLEKIADYITYIRKGRILFSESITDIVGNYKILKGNKEAFESIDKDLCIGLKKSRYGYEALCTDIEKVDKKVVTQMVIERPTLEDIMIFMNRSEI